jgi:peptidoglycan hydrolase-like protein with peptidoglycan-binding domain
MFALRRLAPVVALALLAAIPPTADAAKKVTVPPPLTSAAAPHPTAFDGNGMWIWYVNQSNRGSVSSIAKRAHAAHIQTLFIKAGDGRSKWSQFNKRLVNKLHAKGLHVCAWQYVYAFHPASEAKIGAYAKGQGAECFVIDAESQVEGHYAAASAYMRRLRADVGSSYPIGVAPFPYVDYHPGYPYSVFLGPGGAQFNLPQMYWKAIGVSVDFIYSHTYTYNEIWGRPIAPLGQTWLSPSRSQLLRFRDLASAYRAPGLSWWSWQSTTSSGWSGLSANRAPVNAAKGPTPVAPTLSRGSRGDMVVWAQEHLLGAHKNVKVNGVFDSRTVAGVKSFQRGNHLRITGRIDVRTWQRLLKRRVAKIIWSSSAAARTAKASASGGTAPEPASEKLPATMYEIPPKSHAPPPGGP